MDKKWKNIDVKPKGSDCGESIIDRVKKAIKGKYLRLVKQPDKPKINVNVFDKLRYGVSKVYSSARKMVVTAYNIVNALPLIRNILIIAAIIIILIMVIKYI